MRIGCSARHAPFVNSTHKPFPILPATQARTVLLRLAAWTSSAVAHNPPPTDPPSGSPARYASTRCTGTVRIDPLFQAPVPARVAGASVTFEPGARTAWHTHPLGQTLMV